MAVPCCRMCLPRVDLHLIYVYGSQCKTEALKTASSRLKRDSQRRYGSRQLAARHADPKKKPFLNVFIQSDEPS